MLFLGGKQLCDACGEAFSENVEFRAERVLAEEEGEDFDKVAKE